MRTAIVEPHDSGDEERIFFEGGQLDIIEPEGYGMLRSPEDHCVPGPGDLYVCPFLVKKHSLRPGDVIDGFVQRPLQTVVVAIARINGERTA